MTNKDIFIKESETILKAMQSFKDCLDSWIQKVGPLSSCDEDISMHPEVIYLINRIEEEVDEISTKLGINDKL